MTSFPDSGTARRVLLLLRTTPGEGWQAVRDFIGRRTGGRHALVSDFILEDLAGEQANADREETLRAIVSALESGDWGLLSSDTFQAPAPAGRPADQPAGSKA